MMRSMFSGVSGLRNFQTAMDVVGNNIANVNTAGFKASRVTFESTLSQMLRIAMAPNGKIGGTNAIQIGLGSDLATIDRIMTQGAFQNTGKKTDLAIKGSGFFVLSDGKREYFTRAGNFDVDTDGSLVQLSSGLKVMGWMSELDKESGVRVVDSNKPVEPIKIPFGMTMPAKETTKMELGGNLNSDVGFNAFDITLKDSSSNPHDVRVWFSRGAEISSDPTNPFSDVQRYIYYVDQDGDGAPDAAGVLKMDKFGNVKDAGINAPLATGSDSATTDGSVTLNLTNSYYGDYLVSLKGDDGSVIYTRASIDGNTVTINDDRIKSGVTYDWKVISIGDGKATPNTLTVTMTNGSGTVTDPTYTFNGYYKVVLKDQTTGKPVYTTVVKVDNSNTINISAPVDDGNYDVDVYQYYGDKYEVSDGADLVVTRSGSPKFYEADDPTNFIVPDYTTPKYVTATTIYDSLGKSYQLYMEFVKLGDLDENHRNVWIWRAYLPGGEKISYLDKDGNELSSAIGGVINFDKTGKIDSYGIIKGGKVSDIDWTKGAKKISFSAKDNGDGVVSIALNFDNISQYAGEFSAATKFQDGYATGTLKSFNINDDGDIVGVFSNGRTDLIAKIALATFNNPAGLTDVGGSLFINSANSGNPMIGEPNKGGRGSIVSGALEMSNVDLAEEFTKMIIAQRGFQANARVITTTDQILNELVNLKR